MKKARHLYFVDELLETVLKLTGPQIRTCIPKLNLTGTEPTDRQTTNKRSNSRFSSGYSPRLRRSFGHCTCRRGTYSSVSSQLLPYSPLSPVGRRLHPTYHPLMMMMMTLPSTSDANPRVRAASIDITIHHGSTTSAVGSFLLESTLYMARLDRDGGIRVAGLC